MIMNLKKLQREVSRWANHNFPEAKPHQPLLGLSEEVGELSHAHLKMEQGIRGSVEGHIIAKCDAVGDVMIFLAHYCSLNGISLDAAVEDAWAEVSKRDWRKDPENGKA